MSAINALLKTAIKKETKYKDSLNGPIEEKKKIVCEKVSSLLPTAAQDQPAYPLLRDKLQRTLEAWATKTVSTLQATQHRSAFQYSKLARTFKTANKLAKQALIARLNEQGIMLSVRVADEKLAKMMKAIDPSRPQTKPIEPPEAGKDPAQKILDEYVAILNSYPVALRGFSKFSSLLVHYEWLIQKNLLNPPLDKLTALQKTAQPKYQTVLEKKSLERLLNLTVNLDKKPEAVDASAAADADTAAGGGAAADAAADAGADAAASVRR